MTPIQKEGLLRILASLIMRQAYWETWSDEQMTAEKQAFVGSPEFRPMVECHKEIFDLACDLYEYVRNENDMTDAAALGLLQNVEVIEENAEKLFFTEPQHYFSGSSEVEAQIMPTVDAVRNIYNIPHTEQELPEQTGIPASTSALSVLSRRSSFFNLSSMSSLGSLGDFDSDDDGEKNKHRPS